MGNVSCRPFTYICSFMILSDLQCSIIFSFNIFTLPERNNLFLMIGFKTNIRYLLTSLSHSFEVTFCFYFRNCGHFS